MPLVPLIVNVYVWAVDLVPVVTVRVELAEPATDGGLKLALLREGNPLTLKFTTPVKPFTAVTVAM